MMIKKEERPACRQTGFSSVVIILSIALVLALAGAGYFYLQSQNAKNTIKTAKEAPRPVQPAPSPLVAQPPADQMVYKTFKSADDKFSFDYPGSWTQIDIKNLESMVPKDLIDKRQLEMLLLLTDPTGGRIVLTTYSFDKILNLSQVMDELKADSVKMGAPYGEIDRKMAGNSLVVDYKIKAGGVVMMSRDLVFLSPGADKNDIYVVSLSAAEQTWSKFDTIFARVQLSAKLTVQ